MTSASVIGCDLSLSEGGEGVCSTPSLGERRMRVAVSGRWNTGRAFNGCRRGTESGLLVSAVSAGVPGMDSLWIWGHACTWNSFP